MPVVNSSPIPETSGSIAYTPSTPSNSSSAGSIFTASSSSSSCSSGWVA